MKRWPKPRGAEACACVKRNCIMVPVQFITHSVPGISHERSGELALEGGCRWIQLRMKGFSDDEVEPVARRLLKACRNVGTTFILDDRVELAQKIGADGVHLGQKDMPVDEARRMLGEGMIIGGTANTLEEVRELKRRSADYVGCGPLRFTTTKENLAPMLGFEGLRQIVTGMHAEELRIPLVAIGGVELDDVAALLECGVSGVAVSGAILRAMDPVEMMRRFLDADVHPV